MIKLVARYAYALLALAFVVAILLQVYFMGLGLFDGRQNLELHRNFGWLLHLGPLPILVAAALANAGWRQILRAAALAVTFFIVPSWRPSEPMHPIRLHFTPSPRSSASCWRPSWRVGPLASSAHRMSRHGQPSASGCSLPWWW